MEYDNFLTFNAKAAIFKASEICGQFNNEYIEPEHIFCSILNLRSCSAVQVMQQQGVNLPKLTNSLEVYLNEYAGSFKGTASFSARTLTLLDNSLKEVKRLHHREISTTHLLVALAEERSSFWRKLFEEPNTFLRQLFENHGLTSKEISDTWNTQFPS